MRRLVKWGVGVLAAPVLLIGGVWGFANVDPGRRAIESLTASLTGGTVRIEGLAGRFPAASRVGRLTVADSQGRWLTIDDLALDWSPTRLFSGLARVDALTAARVAVARLPVPDSASTSGGGFTLPVRVAIDRLHVARLELDASVAGQPAIVSVDGSARLDSPQAGDASVKITAGADRYEADLRMTPSGLHAQLMVTEAPRGLLARLASLPDIGAIEARAAAAGPLDRLALDLTLAAGPLRATAGGTVDVMGAKADLTLSATAPAMTPAPDIAWRAVQLAGRVQGPFTAPHATGTLTVEALTAAGTVIEAIRATLSGDAGKASVSATLEGLRLPGSNPDLFAAAPVSIDATVQLDAPGLPTTFALRHPRLQAEGTGAMDPIGAKLRLAIPELAPFAAGVAVKGSTALDIEVLQDGPLTTATLKGGLAVDGGIDLLPGLIGPSGTVDVAVALQNGDVTLRHARIAGRTASLSASGSLVGGVLGFDWSARLSDVSVLQPTLSGAIEAAGNIEGAPDSISVTADLTGDVSARGYNSGRVTARLTAEALPAAPRFQLTAEGTLLDSPVSLSINGTQDPGATLIRINPSAWKSLSAEGSVALPHDATPPTGQVQMRMTRLADLAPLAGTPISGAMTADLSADATTARARVVLERAAVAGAASLENMILDAVVTDPAGRPVVDATLSLAGVQASGVAGSARLTAKGPVETLALSMTADVTDPMGAPIKAAAAGTLRGTDQAFDLSSLRATWKQQTLTLAAPARISFANDLTIAPLRLLFGRSELTASGRVGETLDVTASVRNLPADLGALFAPDFAADGMVNGDLRLSGPSAAPNGTLRARATGLRLRQGPGAALPAGTVTLDATLQGGRVRADAKAVVGASNLSVIGTIPLRPQDSLDLRGRGTIDLAMSDPILTPGGRRARGRLELDMGVVGTVAAPRATGTIRLANAEFQDAVLGARVRGINATVQADGDTLRLTRFDALAGPGAASTAPTQAGSIQAGTIQATGSLGLSGDMPVSLILRASNAQPLTSDLMTVLLDADLTLSGAVATNVALGGTVRVRRADIRIPERLPSSVATIPFRIAGSPPPPPTTARPAPAIALALTLDAPERIFVRGRGVDAELGGRIVFGGTLADPRPTGALSLRRGTFSLIGQTLTLTEGRIDFTGDGLADPSLRLVASSQRGGITANAIVSGRVRDPKVTLSSVPELPQDEVLSRLLFNSSTAKLSPFQIAQVANALASLSGNPLLGDDPLNRMREAVGLDRLTVGTDAAGRPVLEAGRYVADGVYVGTKQGAGGGAQATIQIDIGRGVRLEATTGTGQTSATGGVDPGNATSVGITYQFEY